jgi:glycosyltransferase involved in cell wall biosynthesis
MTIITGSESVKREICSHLGVPSSKVAVTPYAPRSVFKRVAQTSTIEIRKRLGIAGDFILFVGTIEPRKNLQTLARAFAELLHSTPHRPQLVIAGKAGWLMSDFHSDLKLAGVDDKVCFTGYVGDEELRALYSSCSLFVYPSIYEGFGLPPLEAMACGAPVVTSDISAIRETVGTAARLVSPLDVEGLAGVMARLLTDNGEREMLGNLGLEHARKFTWQRTASLTLDVYKEVLARAHAD